MYECIQPTALYMNIVLSFYVFLIGAFLQGGFITVCTLYRRSFSRHILGKIIRS